MTSSDNHLSLRSVLLALSFVLGIALFALNSWFTIPIGVVYAVLLPGFVTLLALQRDVELSWLTIIYSAALGVTAFMFLALGINMLGFLVGNTRPLTIGVLVPAVFLFMCAMSSGHKKWKFTISPSPYGRLSLLEKTLLVTASLMLVCFIVGAANLNNGSNGLLSVLCFLAVPMVIVLLFWKHSTIRGNVAITVLWFLGLGILLSGWLRSWYVSGPDVSLEYRLAEIVSTNNQWSIETVKHAYNSCLSVSLFAPAIGIITKSSVALTFKLIIPLLYSLIVPIVYLITDRFLGKRGAIIAAGFFMAQPVFVVWWWIPIRQQIAFLLFGAILLLILRFRERTRRLLILLLVLSLGLVVAHYTTALIAITYFLIVWIVSSVLSRKKRLASLQSPVPLVIILLLIVSYFVWYAQLTYGFSGVTQFASKSVGGITDIIGDITTGHNKNILAQLFSSPQRTMQAYEQKRSAVIRAAYGEKNMYSPAETSRYPTKEIPFEVQKDAKLETIRQLFIALSKVLVSLGVFVMLWLSIRKQNSDIRRYAVLAASALGMLAITAVLPSFSVSYDLVRTYQQLLFVMAGMFCIIFVPPRKYRDLAAYGLLGFVAVFFVLTSHTFSFFYHSASVPVNFANEGSEYTYRYAERSDVLLGTWLTAHTTKHDTISGDSLARDRMRLTLDPNKSQSMLNTVMPTALPRIGYVIKNSHSNTQKAYDTFESNLFTYNYPTDFLDATKNLIYSNSGDQLYR